MTQQQEQPIHWDSDRRNWNLTLIISLVVGVVGIISQSPFLAIMGLGFAVYSWFNSPKRYLIYTADLVIVYGRPRIKVIPFSDISQTELAKSPMGERLQIRLATGRRLTLMTRNPSEFKERLDEALSRFRGTFQGRGVVEQGPDQSAPY